MSIFTTAEKITNLFLYGEENNPADMTDENIIRPKNAARVGCNSAAYYAA
jgi:hypothetical protein